MGLRTVLEILWRKKKILVVIITPLLLLPLTFEESQVAKCAFGLLLMGIYWVTEALPIPVTGLLPIAIFPLLGVERVSVLAAEYLKGTSFMLLGSVGMALAIEEWNLHRRFALNILMLVGAKIKWIMLGLMLCTAFISMWISNSATTAMMLPVSLAICQEMMRIRREEEKRKLDTDKSEKGENASETMNGTVVHVDRSVNEKLTFKREELNKEELNLAIAMTLCISYSATTGGSGTLTGSPANLVMKGIIDEVSNGKSGLTFTTWAMFSAPVAFINIIICWLWFQLFYFGPRSLFGFKKTDTKRTMAAIKEMLQKEYKKLGKTSFAEVAVIVHFLVLLAFWITFESEFFSGWSTLFKPRYTHSAIPTVLIFVVMFFFPARNPFATKKTYVTNDVITIENLEMHADNEGTENTVRETKEKKSADTLLTWEIIQHRMPWGIFLLIGGGWSLAKASSVSGLSNWLGEQLAVFGGLPIPFICFLLTLFISFFTEFTNNSTVISITQPLVFELARNLGIHPLFFMMPSVLACSFAYMLPCGGLPNAIAFSFGLVKITDMIKAGFVLNLTSVLVLSMAINTWGNPVFDFANIPSWGLLNSTLNSARDPLS